MPPAHPSPVPFIEPARTALAVVLVGTLWWPYAGSAALIGACLGALLGVQLGTRAMMARLRFSLLAGAALFTLLLGLSISWGLTETAVAGAIGPALAMKLAAFVSQLTGCLASLAVLRAAAARWSAGAALELLAAGGAVITLLAPHRDDHLTRPQWLGDLLIRNGLDPLISLLVVGGLAATLSALVMGAGPPRRRSAAVAGALLVTVLVAFGVERLSQQPPAKADALKEVSELTGDGAEGGPADPAGGGGGGKEETEQAREKASDAARDGAPLGRLPPQSADDGDGNAEADAPPPPDPTGETPGPGDPADRGLELSAGEPGADGTPARVDPRPSGDPAGAKPEPGESPPGGAARPADGKPQDGEPQDGTPRDGEPQKGKPQDGDPRNGKPQDGQPQDGEPSDAPPDEADLPDDFSDAAPRPSPADDPVAVLVFDDDPLEIPMFYLRQDALSVFDGTRLVPALPGSSIDRDLVRALPVDEVEPADPAPPGSGYRLTGSVSALVEHPGPFGPVAPIAYGPRTNPDPSRFVQSWRWTSLLTWTDSDDLGHHTPFHPGWSEADRATWLQLPDDPRYVALAHEWAAQIPDPVAQPYATALALTLELGAAMTYDSGYRGGGADPTGTFLFGERRGYCVHSAHATVYLLRSLGIPARVGVGYAVPASDRRGPTLVIRSLNAHAWPELYLDRVGWVVVDVAPARRVDPPAPPLDEAEVRELSQAARAEATAIEQPPSAAEQLRLSFPDLRWLVRLLAQAALIGAVIAWIGHYGVKLYRRLRPMWAGPEQLPTAAYHAALDRLSDAGLHREIGESRESHALRLLPSVPDLLPLVHAHLGLTFGREVAVDPASLHQALNAVSAELAASVPLWRRLLGLLDPTTLYRAR